MKQLIKKIYSVKIIKGCNYYSIYKRGENVMDYCDSCGQSKDDRHSLNEGSRSIALRSF